MLTVQRESAVGESLFRRISDARQKSDSLFEIVRAEALYDRPIRERHRIVFYIGHLEAFDWNLLHENVFGLRSFHPEFDRLFAFGIDPVGGRRLNSFVNTCARSGFLWMTNWQPQLPGRATSGMDFR